ncbi:hypothetical protein [Micromonospora zamorensis]|uniref:hypothetical protein n=1 Tax=Micromonospora zamorensis TaxID=709883 RepID=UPI00081FDA94|nr:hypothetical protein [Micromonospora zamorensis]SCG38281.1 hypothetical protein GA0070619_0629 [Micromonospora zamorensis]
MGEESMDVNLGEVTRRLDRTDEEVRGLGTEMRAGFQSLGDKMERLAFVPAAVYAADRAADTERVRRLEADLHQEVREREEAQKTSGSNRWSLLLAGLGIPASVLAGVVTSRFTN